jgi:uncharacterized protein YukE
MTNVFTYFGLQDVSQLAARVNAADASDLDRRATACTAAHGTLQRTSTDLTSLADTLQGGWTGTAAVAAIAKLRDAAAQRQRQATQLQTSATCFTTVAAAIRTAQATAARVSSESVGLGQELDNVLEKVESVINATSGAGLVNWGVEKLTGVDLEQEATDLLVSLTQPLLDAASGLVSDMQAAIRTYEGVLRTQGQVLRTMPGVVRLDAGPVDTPGDAALRRGALFRAVYGRDPVTPNDMRVARALDMQGDDSGNVDPNARVVVIHITPVPGAGVVYGDAFIGIKNAFDPHSPSSLNDRGDDRGFDPNAAPDDSRASFVIDYENGVVVVRQNASHTDDGHAEVGDPTVGVEQDPSGRVRLQIEAANPLAPQVAQDAHVSVRGDVVIDPHGGVGTADANGKVTRFPSWEIYQSRDGAPPQTVLQRHENDTPLGTGPMIGLPQPTVPVGQDPGALDAWRHTYHPDQGHESTLSELLQYPTTRGDDFFQYPVGQAPYPSVDGHGQLGLPQAHRVG